MSREGRLKLLEPRPPALSSASFPAANAAPPNAGSSSQQRPMSESGRPRRSPPPSPPPVHRGGSATITPAPRARGATCRRCRSRSSRLGDPRREDRQTAERPRAVPRRPRRARRDPRRPRADQRRARRRDRHLVVRSAAQASAAARPTHGTSPSAHAPRRRPPCASRPAAFRTRTVSDSDTGSAPPAIWTYATARPRAPRRPGAPDCGACSRRRHAVERSADSPPPPRARPLLDRRYGQLHDVRPRLRRELESSRQVRVRATSKPPEPSPSSRACALTSTRRRARPAR